MSEHKTAELEGADLDLAVAIAEGDADMARGGFSPSKRWHDAGPIIDRERIRMTPVEAGGTFLGIRQDAPGWLASMPPYWLNDRGATPLVAAMRAYVQAKIGGRVELP
jgi:hypothetical protein